MVAAIEAEGSGPMAGSTQVAAAPSIPRAVALAMLGLLGVGVALATYLVQVKLRLEFDPTYVSSCNFGEALNCDAVQTSEYASVFGYPLALFGAATYAALMGVVGVSMVWGRCERALHEGLVLTGVVMCAHTLYLAGISSFVIGSYCLYCMGMYAVNLGVTVLAAVSYRRRWGKLFDPGALISQPAGLAVALIIGGAALTVALPAFQRVREDTKVARLAQVKEEMEALVVPPPSRDAPPVANEDLGDPPTPSPGTGAPMGMTTRRARMSDVITRKGRSFYEVPVVDDDWILGPKDAPVTIVEFADFECGYCRMLTKNFEPLKETYKDRVRWVFKHFPMDNECNKVMKGTQHPKACDASKAANCSGDQGKFWEMHDRLFAQPHKLNKEDLREHAEGVGVPDMAAWDACMAKQGIDPRIQRDSMLGRTAKISGTPRMYINGHLVPGVHATEVLEYYIQAALEKAAAAPVDAAPEPVEQHGMVKARTARGTFWIDAFECSLDGSGRAVSRTGAMPALVSWIEAHDACEAAGKRMCSEEEWISACTGEAAVDDDANGNFSDDAIEGRMFPYGLFHEGGLCHDQEPKKGGSARPTGSFPRCRTPTGIYDQAGNLAEWTGVDREAAVLTGPNFAYGQKAACRGRSERFGPGYRNETTGFRCCADQPVPPAEGASTAGAPLAMVGQPAPDFEAKTARGDTITAKDLQGKVTIVSFFASWCGPCRKELPALQTFYAAHRKEGVQVIALGVDTEEQAARDFIGGLELSFTVAYDAEAISMGRWGVKGMPTAFLVDQQGVVRQRLVGAKDAELKALEAAALALAANK